MQSQVKHLNTLHRPNCFGRQHSMHFRKCNSGEIVTDSLFIECPRTIPSTTPMRLDTPLPCPLDQPSNSQAEISTSKSRCPGAQKYKQE